VHVCARVCGVVYIYCITDHPHVQTRATLHRGLCIRALECAATRARRTPPCALHSWCTQICALCTAVVYIGQRRALDRCALHTWSVQVMCRSVQVMCRSVQVMCRSVQVMCRSVQRFPRRTPLTDLQGGQNARYLLVLRRSTGLFGDLLDHGNTQVGHRTRPMRYPPRSKNYEVDHSLSVIYAGQIDS
jgi:hypothetical protein